MESKENSGVLVDESICQQASGKYAFKSLGSVSAKGYSRQIFIYEPLNALDTNSGRSQVSTKFFGRHAERREILSLAEDMLNNKGKENASVVAIVGETGVGKTALSLACLNEAKLLSKKQQMSCVSLRANNTADNRRIPFRYVKNILPPCYYNRH
jgi:DNA replication protein DnaC